MFQINTETASVDQAFRAKHEVKPAAIAELDMHPAMLQLEAMADELEGARECLEAEMKKRREAVKGEATALKRCAA